MSERQYARTKALVDEFGSSEVTERLNQQLLKRSETKKNWVSHGTRSYQLGADFVLLL